MIGMQWGNPLHDPLGAFAAYAHHSYSHEQDNTMQPSGSDIKLITNGVNSCVLAHHVLNTKYANPDSTEAQAALATARNVLKFWGIEFEEPKAKEPPIPEPATLVWPPVHTSGRPRFTTLPDVYRENYYHVREPAMVLGEPAISGWNVKPEHQLKLTDSYWNEETLQFRLRFRSDAHPIEFWLDHCKVRVGDEIPKEST